jgi:hypothetical protein
MNIPGLPSLTVVVCSSKVTPRFLLPWLNILLLRNRLLILVGYTLLASHFPSQLCKSAIVVERFPGVATEVA